MISFVRLGTILDPRFKKGWIKISGLPEDAVLEAVKEEIESRYRVQSNQRQSDFMCIYSPSINHLIVFY